ncbi:MAG TPA: biotin/lipoyl-binding protein, partial [Thermodesulfobacteriota bacterium]|nr:biotin/lipoyl-binding protein [Thermodesulfobacteriota bacterium]
MTEKGVSVEAKKPRSPDKKRLLAFVLLGIIVIAAAIGIELYLRYKRTHVSTDDAYVDGRVHVIASKVAGTVRQIHVADNQLVKPGAVLVTIDPVDYDVQLSGAEASLQTEKTKLSQVRETVEAARRQLVQAEAALAEARSNLNVQEANLRQAEKDLERARFLMKKDLIARQEYDRAQTNEEVVK